MWERDRGWVFGLFSQFSNAFSASWFMFRRMRREQWMWEEVIAVLRQHPVHLRGLKALVLRIKPRPPKYEEWAFSFSFLGCDEAWVFLVRQPLIGLLHQPRMTDDYGAFCVMMAGETEVFKGNLPQYHFVHHKCHMAWLGIKPGTAAVGSRGLTACLLKPGVGSLLTSEPHLRSVGWNAVALVQWLGLSCVVYKNL
jgi:hypothetical protein